jgi:hypothetical protein
MTSEPWLTAGLPDNMVNQSRALEILRDRLDRPLLDPMTLRRWWTEEQAAVDAGGPPKRGFPLPQRLRTAGGVPGHPVWRPEDLERWCVEFLGRATDAA